MDELSRAMADYRFAYLMTVGNTHRSHAAAVVPSLAGGELLIREPGNTTLKNARARPAVSLVWPPSSIEEYSLIVDGTAEESPDGITVSPTRAVLHRPAPSPDGSGPCGSDCRELKPAPHAMP